MSNSDVSFAVFDALLREAGFTKVEQPDAVFRYVHDESDTVVLVRIREIPPAFPARLQPLLQKGHHLFPISGVGQLLAQYRREVDGHGGDDVLIRQPRQGAHEGTIALHRGLGEPVAAERPPAVIEHERQVGVQRKDQVTDRLLHAIPTG